MENNNTPQQDLRAVSRDNEEVLEKIAEKRNAVPVAFAAVVILFFFSFVNFKCNDSKVASLSGFNLVTGTHIQTPMSGMNDMSGFFNGGNSNASKGEKVPSNNWAILAFLSAIAGAAVFYKRVKKESLIGFIIGIIGVVSLLVLRWAVKSAVESEVGNGMINIEVDFAFGYWMSLLLFIVAGGISYLRLKREKPIAIHPDADTAVPTGSQLPPG